MSLVNVALGTAMLPAYASMDEADAWMLGDAGPLRTSWTAASADDQRRALVTATRTLDRLPWRGTKATAGQATAWPRAGVGAVTVPNDIEVAAILIAAHRVAYPEGPLADAATVAEEEIGEKRVRYFHHLADVVERVVGGELAVDVRPYVAPWLAAGPKAPFAAAD